MQIKTFYDENTATNTYVVTDESVKRCAVIDSVYDFDPASGRLTTQSADRVIQYIKENNLTVDWILETHIHADHLTAAQYLKKQLGGKIGIGSHITDVLKYWVPVFNIAKDTPLDGSQFDMLFADGATFQIGNINVKVIHTPGHTPACVSYYMDNAVFVGDALFMPTIGTGRADFPGGSAETLHQSLQRVLSLPDAVHIFSGHDYPPQGQSPSGESTVASQKHDNIMINEKVSREAFISARTQRDAKLPVPKLLLPALQFNLRAGSLGNPEENNTHYLKIPITPT